MTIKKVKQVLEYLQEIKDDVESHYALYVTDRQNTLKGVVSLSDIATSDFEVSIADIMNPNVISGPLQYGPGRCREAVR